MILQDESSTFLETQQVLNYLLFFLPWKKKHREKIAEYSTIDLFIYNTLYLFIFDQSY